MTDKDPYISSEVFRSLVDSRGADLLLRAAYVKQYGSIGSCYTRRLLQGIAWGAAELEEILDAYGASRNRSWYPFRRHIASAKLFSNVSYVLQHLLLFLPTYRLTPLEHDFASGTEKALRDVCVILRRCLDALLGQARTLGLQGGTREPQIGAYVDELPAGRLPPDRQSHKVASPEQTVASVATAFLNLAEDSAFIHLTQKPHEGGHAEWIPDPVNEARLRDLEQRFHSLQSRYDTHISDTNVESLDPDLPMLRGHISVIYHLLEVATALTHYCERHILSFSPKIPEGVDLKPFTDVGSANVVSHAEVLDVLLGYALAFTSRYVTSARGLCHEMLKRYAIQGHITVPVPRYRGFHVRPSTMIAKIVAHFGSEVTMALEQETYNAGFTLDLFRANEKINAVKRRLLARAVESSLVAEPLENPGEPEALVRVAAQRLFSQGKLVLYDRNLTLESFALRGGESLPELVTRALIHMLTMGKIDVDMEIMVSFYGDRRVLEDIKLLAGNGYGEDDFGNNLPLPQTLSYLRK